MRLSLGWQVILRAVQTSVPSEDTRKPIFHCGEDGGVCTALLAYASRHLSGEHLEDLLARTNPSSTLSAPRSSYGGLPSAEESLRYTFENIGHQVLASIEVPKVWLLDRGLNHGLLLRALGMSSSPSSRISKHMAKDFDGALGAMRSATAVVMKGRRLNGHSKRGDSNQSEI